MKFKIRVSLRSWFLAAGISFGLLSAGFFSAVAAEPGRHSLHGHVPAAVSRLQPQGLLPATNRLQLAIGLPLRNPAALDEFLRQLYEPGSTNFHKFLVPEQFAARFGPTAADFRVLVQFAETNGFTVIGGHGNGLVLDVTASATNVERAFRVALHTYRHPQEPRDFFAPDTEPSVPTNLPVADIQGLSDFGRPHPLIHLRPAAAQISPVTPNSGSGSGGSYQGNDFRAAYVPGTALTGAKQIVGLVQFDGFYSNDITAYEAATGIPAVSIQTDLQDGFNGVPTIAGNDEVSLDIEMVIAMAPGIAQLIVYEGDPNNFLPNDVLNCIVTNNLARQISSSWSWTGGPDTTTDNLLAQMAAQGQSFFQASGDSDAYTGANVLDAAGNSTTPVDSPYVTSVGGTTLSTTGPGGAWSSETVWNWNNSGQPSVGSSGGISTHYSMPNWQAGISMAANQGSTTMRNIPDVALTADNVYVIYGNGSSGNFGGTSCAAPLWAGFCALVNQQAALAAKPPVGFLNPTLYALATNANYSTLFHDTTTGNNTGTNTAGLFNAVTGYDLATGLGTPNGMKLINVLAPPVFFTAITNTGWTLLAESATPTNGVIDPGETVTVSFTLQNQGTLATANLVATLQANAGVLAPGGSQSYGALAALGGSASRSFTFTAAGACGANLVANLQLQDGTNNLGVVSFALPLGKISGLTQNFDAVAAPSLPSGWTTVNLTGTANNWITTTAASDTPPRSAFITDAASISENALVSPVIPIITTNAQLSFRHNFSLEYAQQSRTYYYDGGVLEVKIGTGTFTDILAAGGSFIGGGYNNSITTTSDNPLGGHSAWVGNSSGWKTVTVKLPASAAGKNIQLRWNCATDTGNAGGSAVGWYVDSISITDGVPDCLSVLTDLAASQSLAASSLNAGQNLIYTLAVTNLGPQAAANVLVTDTVPANAAFVAASPGYNYSAGRVVWAAGMLPVAAATNFTLTLSPTGGNTFSNVVTVGTVTPEITTVNNTATLISTQTVSVSAGISAGPAGQVVQCGGNAAFSIATTGTAPLSIQWSLDGQPIFGATNISLSLTNLHLPNHTVTVTVTNLSGSVTSNTVVTVIDTLPPVITLNGGNPIYVELGGAFTDPGATASDLCAGVVPVTLSGSVNTSSVGTNTLTYTANDGNGNPNAATRTVIVHDTTPPAIAWSFTNLVLAADTNCSAMMPEVTGTNYILATDLSGALTISQSPTNGFLLPLGTNTVVITVADASGNTAFSTNLIVVQDQTPPLILSQPPNQTNLVGTAAGFSIAATACTPLAYQWLFNHSVLSNQTNSTLTLAAVNLTNAGNYTVTVTAAGGSTNSAVATLTVFDPVPVIAGVAANPDGSFTLKLAGAPGSTYVLQTTTNLTPVVVWLPIATNTLDPGGVWQFTDPQAANFQQQFYRLELAP